MTGARFSCVWVLCLAASVAAAAAEFPSYGVAWSARLASPIVGPPAIDQEHVHLPLRSGRIVTLSVSDGHELWGLDLPVSQPLALDAERLFAITAAAVVAIDAVRGRQLWQFPISGVTVPSSAHAGWVMVGAGADLLALRASDGKLVWRVTMEAALADAVTISGASVYAPLVDGTVAAVDILRGAIAWRTKLPAEVTRVTAAGDRLFVGSRDNFFYSLDADDGGRRWRWRTAADVAAPAAQDGSRVYFVALDNILRALDFGSGVQRWRALLEMRPLSGPVLEGDLLIVSGGSELRAIRAKDGTLAGRFSTPAELAAPAAFVPDAEASGTHIVIVTGSAIGDWRAYGLAPAPPSEPAAQPLTEIPGRPLSPGIPPAPPAAPPPAG